jgi:hypothetical protein
VEGWRFMLKWAQQADDLGIPMKLRPPVTKVPYIPADPSRLAADAARAPGSPQQLSEGSASSPGNEVDRRTLIVGQGISLTGEVTSCDRLIVEGTIEAKLDKCQHVIIAETGVFHGQASTENADVRGRLEGVLVVSKRLLIRAGVMFPVRSPTGRLRSNLAVKSQARSNKQHPVISFPARWP